MQTAETLPFRVDFDGETLAGTFRPAALTPALWGQMQASLPCAAAVALIEAAVVEWNLRDNADIRTFYPLTAAALMELPLCFVGAVAAAICTAAGEATHQVSPNPALLVRRELLAFEVTEGPLPLSGWVDPDRYWAMVLALGEAYPPDIFTAAAVAAAVAEWTLPVDPKDRDAVVRLPAEALNAILEQLTRTLKRSTAERVQQQQQISAPAMYRHSLN